MQTVIRAGEIIETATPEDVRHALRQGTSDYFQELARGVGPWRSQAAPVTVAAAAVTIPSTHDNAIGPNPGFCVMVTTIRVLGLSSGDVIKVFRNSAKGEQVDELVMPATGTLGILREGSRGLFLNSAESLVFTGASLTATGDISVSVEGVECASTDAYKTLLA